MMIRSSNGKLDWRLIGGIAASLAWCAVCAHLMMISELPRSLNEWGDALAGFFAPLAFFWLVIGYLQQGQELRQSTVALQLQAEELRNSVEQQSRLVEVSRLQLQQETEALQEERARRREAALPRFVVTQGTTYHDVRGTRYELIVRNVGSVATRGAFEVNSEVRILSSPSWDILQLNDRLTLTLMVDIGVFTTVGMRYLDAEGLPGLARFTLAVSDSGQLTLGEVIREF